MVLHSYVCECWPNIHHTIKAQVALCSVQLTPCLEWHPYLHPLYFSCAIWLAYLIGLYYINSVRQGVYNILGPLRRVKIQAHAWSAFTYWRSAAVLDASMAERLAQRRSAALLDRSCGPTRASVKLLIGKVLCQGDFQEIYEGITLLLRHYGQPLVIIELGITFSLSIHHSLFCLNSRGVLC